MDHDGTHRDLAARLTGWRHHLHANPELGRFEADTSAFVCARLAELGVPFKSGVGGHGVVATLARGHSNRSVGLRADMDALPIEETTGLAYASTRPGAMHACGHDGHTASLLGAAALLTQDDSWTGTIQLVFQPAEEGMGGALAMLADGLLERFPMERIYGYHNWPGLKAGAVAVHVGAVMAAGARLKFEVHGHAGHAALPHLTRDPMIAAAHLLLALQTIVARQTDPLEAAVLSLTTIQAGSAANQIADHATLTGTMRTLHRSTRDAIEDSIRRIAAGTAMSFGVGIDVDIARGIEVTENTREDADLAATVAGGLGLEVRRDMPPAMTGEDFSWFLKERPGAFVWIGNGPSDGGRDLHNPNYDYNDAILPVAASYLAAMAKAALR